MLEFTEAVAVVARRLRETVPSHSVLNRAASRIDRLGRELHGLGFAHEGEIADHFTAAVGDLFACRALPEEDRPETVRRAVLHLEGAMGLVETGGLSW